MAHQKTFAEAVRAPRLLSTRREFLAAAVAAPIVSPILLGMQDKAGSRLPVMGEGAHRYEATHDWGQLPPHLKWGNTHAVVQDSKGLVYVHHTVHATSEVSDAIVVFDPNGKFVRSWGREFRGVAHGMDIRREGSQEFLYLTANSVAPGTANAPEMQGSIVKMTLTGEIVWRMQGPPDTAAYRPGPDGRTPSYNPTNLGVAPNGDVYVADGYGSSYINHYNAKGEYIRTFGGRGSEPGKLAEPHGIWIDTRGTTPIVVVADRRNNRLQRFSLDGAHLDFVSGFRLPGHFHERNGTVVIPDLHGRVTLIDRNNAVIVHLGDSNLPDWHNPLRTKPREEFVPGQFMQPHGACFDRDGNIFVTEWVEVGRVTRLRHVG